MLTNVAELEDQAAPNPYLDALPETLAPDEVAQKLMYSPFNAEEIRRKPAADRRVDLEDLDDLFCPRFEHIHIYNTMNALMRSSYRRRNPLSPAYIRSTYGISARDPMRHNNGSTIVLTGVTGAGKTKTVNAIANFFPQCIDHGLLTPGSRPLLQFPIIVVRCGGDPSPKGLCRQVFHRLAQILGDEPQIRLPSDRAGVQGLTQAMHSLCMLYGIGLIVWDEFQDLVQRTRMGDREVCNLLLATRDILNVPMMLVGTFPILEALQKQDTRVARRSAAYELLLPRFESASEDAWENMCKKYLKSHVLQGTVDATPTIARRFYEYSQGIPGFFIAVFKATQQLALDHGFEAFGLELIEEAFNTRCISLHGPVAALASGDTALLKAFPDIWSPLLRHSGTELLKMAGADAQRRKRKKA